jgi:hypothetical protein
MSVFDKNRCECASAHQPEGQKGGDGVWRVNQIIDPIQIV